MFGQNVTLFTLFGFRVRANMSWALLFALVLWSLSAGFFPMQFPELGQGLYWTMGLLGSIGLFFSLLFHEFSHALIARFRGMEMGGITLFLFGGMAEMTEEPPTPRIEAEIAAAGPIASVVLAGVFYALGTALGNVGLAEHWVGVFAYLGLINIVLAVFNMVPGYPLDGGRLLRAFLWYMRDDLVSATRWAARVGQGFAVLLILLGIWSFLTAGALGGLWWVLIGLFLNAAAKSAYQQTMTRRTFAGVPIHRFMTPDPVSVPPDLPLDRFVEDYAFHYHYSVFPVAEDGKLLGCLRSRDVKTVARERWGETAVRQIMQRCHAGNTVDRASDAENALKMMQQSETSQLMVTQRGGLVGMVTLRDLLSHLALRQDLEGWR